MEGSLLLDITVSRVNVEGASLKDKARRLAEHFPRLVVITIDGKTIRTKAPDQNWDDESWVTGRSKRQNTIEQVLNELEVDVNGAPIAIFGYSQMIRGDSFRSDFRVPTHMVQMLSNAMSVDRLVQSAGRSSFLGKEKLQEIATATAGGGHGHVRVLMTFLDYLTVRAYVEFMSMIADEINTGAKVEELFDPAKREGKYLPHFSILVGDYQRRTIGNRNEKLHDALDRSLFQTDKEAEAAFAVSDALIEVERLERKALKRHAAACDQSKSLTLRLKNAEKCYFVSVVDAQEQAKTAREKADRSKQAADKSKREGVRPSAVAECEAEDAAVVLASLKSMASEAMRVAWLADLARKLEDLKDKTQPGQNAKYDKLVQKIEDFETNYIETRPCEHRRWEALSEDTDRKLVEQAVADMGPELSKLKAQVDGARESSSKTDSSKKKQKVEQGSSAGKAGGAASGEVKRKSPFPASDPKPEGDGWHTVIDPRSKENPPAKIWVDATCKNDVERLDRVLVVERKPTTYRYMCAKCHYVFWGSVKVLKEHMRGGDKAVANQTDKSGKTLCTKPLAEDERRVLDAHDDTDKGRPPSPGSVATSASDTGATRGRGGGGAARGGGGRGRGARGRGGTRGGAGKGGDGSSPAAVDSVMEEGDGRISGAKRQLDALSEDVAST